MKRKIFAVFTIFAALLLASCSVANTLETDLEQTIDSPKEAENSNEAYITISVKQDGKRTALPAIGSLNDFTSFNLVAKINNVTKIDKTWTSTEGGTSAYSKMLADSIAVEKNKSYYFILTAKVEGVTYQGSLNQRITQGENNLSFALELKELSESPEYDVGALWIFLSFPSVVKEFDAELTHLDGTAVDPLDPMNINGIETEQYIGTSINGTSGQYIAYPIYVGNYIVNFTFYGDTEKTLKLGQWREYAGIAGALCSSSEISIESEDELESVYSITLHPDNGTLSTTTPGSYTRYSSEIVLPTASQISRTGYHFDGWYDAETGGNRVESIPAGSVGNKSLYAHWSLIDYTITVNYNTQWGTVTIPATAHYNEAVSLSFAPKTGCQFNSITSQDVSLAGSGSSRSFTMPASNITITATFAKTHLGTKDSPNAVWDIIFNDGTAIPYSSSLTLTQAQKEAAIAILYYHEDDDNYIYGIALKHANKVFCPPSAYYYDRHDDLSPHDGQYNSYMITQSNDYSENNYPAVWWTKHYQGYNGNVGAVAGDVNGPYYHNWYVPSIQELEVVYDRRETLSNIINLIGSPYADPLIPEGNTWYRSTSQINDNTSADATYLKDFAEGWRVHGSKMQSYNTLAIRKFTPVNGVSN